MVVGKANPDTTVLTARFGSTKDGVVAWAFTLLLGQKNTAGISAAPAHRRVNRDVFGRIVMGYFPREQSDLLNMICST